MSKQRRGAETAPGAGETQVEPAQTGSTRETQVEPAQADTAGASDARAELEPEPAAARELSEVAALRAELDELRRSYDERLSRVHELVRDGFGQISARVERIAPARMEVGARSSDTASIASKLRVRVRDGRRRHPRAAHTFGRGWQTLDATELTESQFRAITTDPVLEVEIIE